MRLSSGQVTVAFRRGALDQAEGKKARQAPAQRMGGREQPSWLPVDPQESAGVTYTGGLGVLRHLIMEGQFCVKVWSSQGTSGVVQVSW